MKKAGSRRCNRGNSFVLGFAKFAQMWQKNLRSQAFSPNLLWAEPSHNDRRHHHLTQHPSSAIPLALGKAWQPLNRLNIPPLGIWYYRKVNWEYRDKDQQTPNSCGSAGLIFGDTKKTPLFLGQFKLWPLINFSLQSREEVGDLRPESYFPNLTTKLIWLLKWFGRAFELKM